MASATRVGLVVVGALTLAAVGAAAGVAYTTPAVPADLQASTSAATFPVTETSFEDARAVKLQVVRGSTVTLTSPGAGRVTRSACTPGEPIVSGTSPFALDDTRVVALATALPLWRDLEVGAKGDDVTALQEELARLGHPVTVDGRMTAATLRAFTKLLASLGETGKALTSVPVARVLWLPAPSTVVESCAVGTGATLAAGDDVGVVPGALSRLAVADPPVDLVDGARVLTVDGTRVELGPELAVTDPAALAPLDGLPSLQAPKEGAEPPSGRLSLATPVAASVVPPSAVFGTGTASCVQADGTSLPVRVVGSELGQSFVVFDAEPPTHVDVKPPQDAACG